MSKTYLRPVGLVFGQDAREMIMRGLAFSLGGLPHIGFQSAEVISRDGASISRRIISGDALKVHGLLQAIIARRPDVAGLSLDQTRIMGIVNVTPDSFSDGGKFDAADAAIAHGRLLAQQGADILDIGGESTRPGSDDVQLGEERQRIMPVIAALANEHIVSVDTRKSSLMAEAAKCGAKIINDVSALQFDSASAGVVARSDVPVILMHAQGNPRTMQLAPKYDDVALDVYDGLAALIAKAEAAGIERARICVDPGIGFGKSFRHNLDVMRQLTLYHGLGVAMLVGLSRKGFVGAVTGEKTAGKRMAGSIGGALQAAMMGAHLLRVHDVLETVQSLAMFNAGLNPESADV
ncbi:MAG: dihydropteroate synthase [Alphaproteobacteria bacterium]|nr:dihydropteroate synthase [Alphaproteobacteria bacterium]